MRILPRWDEAFLVALVKNMSVYKQDGSIRPHKALLLILMLEHFKTCGFTVVEYADIAPKLKKLIARLSPRSGGAHPEYPFWYLQNDHLLEVFYQTPLKVRRDKDEPPHKSLVAAKAVAKLPRWIEKLLKKNGKLPLRIQKMAAEQYVGVDLEDILAQLRDPVAEQI